MRRPFLFLTLAMLTACGGGSSTPTPPVGATTNPATGQNNSSNALSLSASSLDFTATGYTLTFVASEAGYSGTMSAKSSDCNGIATFSPTQGSGPQATFSVISVTAGKCSVTVSDTNGSSATVTVNVTTTTGTIQ